jgi:hypothetical protein
MEKLAARSSHLPEPADGRRARPNRKSSTLASMRLSRAEVDELLRRADELVTKLRRATLELAALGNRLMSERQEGSVRRSR